ncbi:hypothetical protein NPIL_87631 [Nephila pilipes]|uniref:Uncharacterized protein n=1 Tax=Nephila pilipes TaxID=299642 RepID=A0A8X6TSM8_NEPPI|nr:hypothetical protein NPIL_87631 [Nephila pilipes]
MVKGHGLQYHWMLFSEAVGLDPLPKTCCAGADAHTYTKWPLMGRSLERELQLKMSSFLPSSSKLRRYQPALGATFERVLQNPQSPFCQLPHRSRKTKLIFNCPVFVGNKIDLRNYYF